MFSSFTHEEIRNNPLNTSTSKNQWSFGKASRFITPHQKYFKIKHSTKVFTYEKKSSLSNRKASIGYGTRSGYFDGKRESLDPSLYYMSSTFRNNKTGGVKGFNFGYSRDQLNFSNYLSICEKTPGPGNYNKNETKSRAYSMRPKTSYPKNYFLPSDPEAEKSSYEPGPGKYIALGKMSEPYLTSNYQNKGTRTFSHNQRFLDIKASPGPADYNNSLIEPEGKCFLSTMRGSGQRRITQEKRELKLEGNKYTPGPGSYRQPSDFGHYESRIRPDTAFN